MYTSDPGYEEPRPIVRLTSRGSYAFLSLQKSVHGVKTHWNGQSIPCPGEQSCPLCQDGEQPRFVCYLAVRQRNGKVAILEIPHSQVTPFKRQEQNGGLLGSVIGVQKLGDKSEWQTTFGAPRGVGSDEEIDAEELLDWLCRIYGMPRRAPCPSIADWKEAIERAAVRRLKAALEKRMTQTSS